MSTGQESLPKTVTRAVSLNSHGRACEHLRLPLLNWSAVRDATVAAVPSLLLPENSQLNADTYLALCQPKLKKFIEGKSSRVIHLLGSPPMTQAVLIDTYDRLRLDEHDINAICLAYFCDDTKTGITSLDNDRNGLDLFKSLIIQLLAAYQSYAQAKKVLYELKLNVDGVIQSKSADNETQLAGLIKVFQSIWETFPDGKRGVLNKDWANKLICLIHDPQKLESTLLGKKALIALHGLNLLESPCPGGNRCRIKIMFSTPHEFSNNDFKSELRQKKDITVRVDKSDSEWDPHAPEPKWLQSTPETSSDESRESDYDGKSSDGEK